MSKIKTPEEIEILKEGGKRLSAILHAVRDAVKPGVRTIELDEIAESLIREGGDEPSFLNYKPDGVSVAFPASLCVSVNDEVVHGIPDDYVLQEGDIVGIDCGLIHKGLYTDMAMTVPVGEIDEETRVLVETTKKSLNAAIRAVRAGARIGDIGHAVEQIAEKAGYGIVHQLGGHGVGHAVHEPPYVPNFGDKGKGEKLEVGQVLALEPMLNLGEPEVKLGEDRFTFVTRDGKRSAHFEVTLAVTEKGALVLTPQ